MANKYNQKILTQDKYLTQREVKKLLKAPDRRYLLGMRDFAIFKILLNCGLRRKELITLTVSDYHNESSQTWLSVHSKGGQILDQPINTQATISAINKYLKCSGHGADPEAPLFQTIRERGKSTGNRMNPKDIHNLMQKYAKKAELKKHLHAHMLRHTFGTQFYQVTKDLVTTQRAMRHKSGNSTLIYLHSDKSQVLEGLKQLKF